MSDCRFGVSPVNYPDPDPEPVCGLTLYKLRSSVLTGSLKLSVLCEILRVGIVISGLLIVNHGFRFR